MMILWPKWGSTNMATRRSIKDLADRLILTLSSTMSNENADAIVRDVAEEIYSDLLETPGKIVPKSQAIVHGSFGDGRRAMVLAEYEFKPDEREAEDVKDSDR